MVGEGKVQVPSNGRQLGIAPGSSRYLIMEFCPGGELFDHIVEQGRVKEPEAVLGLIIHWGIWGMCPYRSDQNGWTSIHQHSPAVLC